VDGLHLVALSAFAVAQPLLHVLGNGATFFVARNSTSAEIVWTAAAVTFLPGLALSAVELAVWAVLGRWARWLAHTIFVAALLGLIALPLVSRHIGSPTLAFGLSAAVGVSAVALYRRARSARTLTTILAPAPLVFLGAFLFFSSATRLVVPDNARAGSAAVRSRAPVVVVVFDEFSGTSLLNARGQIDGVRFPNFASLARGSLWFPNAMTAALATERAVPVVLSGRFSRPGSLAVFQDHPDNLFTLLGPSYALNVHETETRLCPPSLCSSARPAEAAAGAEGLASDLGIVYGHVVLPDQLAKRLPSVATTWGNFAGDELHRSDDFVQASAFDRFLRSIRPRSRPALDFVHVELPHLPWHYLPSGHDYASPATVLPPGLHDSLWGSERWLVDQAHQRYLMQVGFVDLLLGRLIRRLKAEGMYNRALLVVTADHGVSFHPNEGRRTTVRHREDLAFVPLFVKLPHQRRGRVVDAAIQTTDVLPTIADALGTRVPWPTDGSSALRAHSLRLVRIDGDTFDVAGLLRRRRRDMADDARRFGAGQPWDRLFAVGPDAQLTGRSVATLPQEPSGELRARIADSYRLQSVAPETGVVPAYIWGTVTGRGASAGLELAVSVNGRIGSGSRTYSQAGSIMFSLLLPETLLRAGSNEVTIYAVHRAAGSAGRLSLQPLGGVVKSPTFALVTGRRGSWITSTASRRKIRIVPGAVTGYLDGASVQDGTVRFLGWAARRHPPRIRDRVVVFADGRFVYQFDTVLPGARPDLGSRLDNAGFDFTIPLELLEPRGHRAHVQIFGIIGGVASELVYPAGYEFGPHVQ
jgi:hypothetical protein